MCVCVCVCVCVCECVRDQPEGRTRQGLTGAGFQTRVLGPGSIRQLGGRRHRLVDVLDPLVLLFLRAAYTQTPDCCSLVASKGWICFNNGTCCFPEKEVAGQSGTTLRKRSLVKLVLH